jgi:tRNA-specific 2-thiouridylase
MEGRGGAKKVFVGLSGGVDSAVSAALLMRQGYRAVGAFIRISLEGYPCTAGQDRIDAMRAAAHLKIPFEEIDLSREYGERVFAESMREFGRGHTPNPDALCNREIKFGLFHDWARARGADLIATGHYARMKDGLLFEGADPGKDQSYFLWAAPQEALRRTLFPVGHLKKPQVRALARKLGLPNAARKDSQGLCFLGPVSVGDMLKKELRPEPGAVLNEAGEVIGAHEGAALYTMGQRHGFALSSQGPDAAPRYVIGKDVRANTVTVSERRFPAGAARTELVLSGTNWIGPVESGPCLARYRYRQQPIEAELDVEAGIVTLMEPHYAPEGQSLVAYKHGRCLGGGIIREVRVY